jgi:hypothetical protein
MRRCRTYQFLLLVLLPLMAQAQIPQKHAKIDMLEVTGPILGTLLTRLDRLSDSTLLALTNASPALADSIDSLGVRVQNVITGLNGKADSIRRALDSIAAHRNIINGLLTTTQAHTDSIAALRSNVNTALAGITPMGAVRDSLKHAYDSLAAHRSVLNGNLTTLAAHLDSLAAHRAQLNIALAGMPSVGTIMDSLKHAYDSLTVLRGVLNGLLARDIALTDSIAALRNRVNPLLSEMLTVHDSLKHVYDSLATVRTNLTYIYATIYSMRDSLKDVAEIAARSNDSTLWATQYDLTGVCNLTSTGIDWSLCPQFKDTLATSSVTYTFSNVAAGTTIKVNLVTDGSRLNSAVWPTTVYWPTGTTNPTSSMYASSVYDLEFTAYASDFIMGRLIDYRSVSSITVAADTTAPDSSRNVYASRVTPTTIEYRWLPPASVDQGYEPVTYTFKLQAGKHIGYSTADGAGGTTPAVNKLKTLQKGTWTIAAGSNNTTITLPTAATLAKSIAIVNTSSNQAQENFARVGYGLTGTTSLYVRRWTSGSSPAISGTWKVMEYETGATVEHGSFIFDNDSLVENVAIASSNVDSTFLLFSYPDPSTTTTGTVAFVRGEITSATNARFTRAGTTGSSVTMYFQVVKLDSTVVYSGSQSIAASDTSKLDKYNRHRYWKGHDSREAYRGNGTDL